MESKHTEAAPDRRTEDGGALAPVRSPEGGGGLGVFDFHDVPSRRFAPRFVYF